MKVKPIGDLDGDGVVDVAFAVGSGAYIRLFSGRTAQPIGTDIYTPIPDGWPGLTGSDIDLDGVPDVIVASGIEVEPNVTWASVLAFSGRDRRQIMALALPRTQNGWQWEGYDLLFLRGAAGARFPRLASSNPFWGEALTPSSGRAGRVRLLECIPPDGVFAGPGCAGTLLRVPELGISSLGFRDTRINLSRAPGGTPAILLLGISRHAWSGATLPLDLGILGWHGCHLRTSIELSFPVLTGTTGLDQGHASVTLGVPPVARALGTAALHAQWLVLGSGASGTPGFSAMQGFWFR